MDNLRHSGRAERDDDGLKSELVWTRSSKDAVAVFDDARCHFLVLSARDEERPVNEFAQRRANCDRSRSPAASRARPTRSSVLQAHLQLLEAERRIALSGALADDVEYMADLVDELDETLAAYTVAAVVELALDRRAADGAEALLPFHRPAAH
jgi:hypothetical protein